MQLLPVTGKQASPQTLQVSVSGPGQRASGSGPVPRVSASQLMPVRQVSASQRMPVLQVSVPEPEPVPAEADETDAEPTKEILPPEGAAPEAPGPGPEAEETAPDETAPEPEAEEVLRGGMGEGRAPEGAVRARRRPRDCGYLEGSGAFALAGTSTWSTRP